MDARQKASPVYLDIKLMFKGSESDGSYVPTLVSAQSMEIAVQTKKRIRIKSNRSTSLVDRANV